MGKLRLSCPECGVRLRVPEGTAARVLKCPSCGTAISDWSGLASAEAAREQPEGGAAPELKPMGTPMFLVASAANAAVQSILRIGYSVKRLGERRSAGAKVLLCLVPSCTAFLVAFGVWVLRPQFMFLSAGSLAAGLLYLVVNVVVLFAVPSTERIGGLLNRLRARQRRWREALALAREIAAREREAALLEEAEGEEGAPAPAEEAPVGERPPSYPALRILSTIYGAFAWLALSVGGAAFAVGLVWGVVRFIWALARGGEVSFLDFIMPGAVAGGGLAGVMVGLLLLAFAELLGLLPDMRSDSWRANQLLERLGAGPEGEVSAQAEEETGE